MPETISFMVAMRWQRVVIGQGNHAALKVESGIICSGLKKKKITEKAEKDLDVSLNNARVSAILLKKKTNMGKLRNDEGNRATVL